MGGTLSGAVVVVTTIPYRVRLGKLWRASPRHAVISVGVGALSLLPPPMLLLAGAVIGYYVQEGRCFWWVTLGGVVFVAFGGLSEFARRVLNDSAHKAISGQGKRAVAAGHVIEGDF
jgi:hypothetical protein